MIFIESGTVIGLADLRELFPAAWVGMSVMLSDLGEASIARAWSLGTAAKLTVPKALSVDTSRHGFSAVVLVYCLQSLALRRNFIAPKFDVEFIACFCIIEAETAPESSVGASLTAAGSRIGEASDVADSSTGAETTSSGCWIAEAVIVTGAGRAEA